MFLFPFFILSDFNVHNYSWGSDKVDDHGLLIMNLIDEFNSNILNNGSYKRIAVPPLQIHV